MIYSHEVETMCPIAQGVAHGAAPIPEEAKWVKAKEIKDISGFTHGIGWCAPQQGTCKLTLNVKEGVIQEALVETIGCSGMTHSAAMAAEILPGRTILEALNTDLVCDAINTAMRDSSFRSFTVVHSLLSLRAVLLSVQVLKISVRVSVHRLVLLMVHSQRVLVTSNSLTVISLVSLLMRIMRSSAISS